jgi:hypothetical protein
MDGRIGRADGLEQHVTVLKRDRVRQSPLLLHSFRSFKTKSREIGSFRRSAVAGLELLLGPFTIEFVIAFATPSKLHLKKIKTWRS